MDENDELYDIKDARIIPHVHHESIWLCSRLLNIYNIIDNSYGTRKNNRANTLPPAFRQKTTKTRLGNRTYYNLLWDTIHKRQREENQGLRCFIFNQ